MRRIAILLVTVWLIMLMPLPVGAVKVFNEQNNENGESYIYDDAGIISMEVAKKINATGRILDEHAETRLFVVLDENIDEPSMEKYGQHFLQERRNAKNGVVLFINPLTQAAGIVMQGEQADVLPADKNELIMRKCVRNNLAAGKTEKAALNGYLALRKVISDKYGVRSDKHFQVAKLLHDEEKHLEAVNDIIKWSFGAISLLILCVSYDLMFFDGRMVIQKLFGRKLSK